MIRWLLIALITVAGVWGLGHLIARDGGYILIAYDQTTVETSLWMGALLLVAAFGVLYATVRMLVHLAGPRGRVSVWRTRKRRQREQVYTHRGLLAFIEGNWEKSRRLLAKAADKAEAPLVSYLMAARASQAEGDRESTQKYLRLAEQTNAGATIAIGLTQAELQLNSEQFEAALATLTRLRKEAPRHPVVLRMLARVYERLEDWDHLRRLLPELRRQKLMSEPDWQALQEKTFCALLHHARQPQDGVDRVSRLREVWHRIPGSVQKKTAVTQAYVEGLMAVGAGQEAEKVLRHQLKREWDGEWVRLYGLVQGKDVGKQLLVAENWLKSRPNNAELLLTLGRIALMNQQWDRAQDYFRASLNLRPQAETHAELGRLFAHLHEHEKSNQHFEQGLLLSTHELPSLPMPQSTGR